MINVDVHDDGVLLDLIALEACPFAGLELPAGWPFVIRIVDHQVAACAEVVEGWATDEAVISLRFVYDPSGVTWLDVAAADHHLILAIG